ncbi:hypothetical protein OY671_009177, partial [Metschnikowia pulcherrima]
RRRSRRHASAGWRPGSRADARRRLRAVSPGRRAPSPAGAARPGPAVRRRHPGELLHRSDQRVRARPPRGRREVPGARRLKRHRPDRDPAGARLWRRGSDHGGQPGKSRGSPEGRRAARADLPRHRLRGGGSPGHRRPGRGRDPRHGRRRLHQQEHPPAGGEWPAGADRLPGRQQDRDRRPAHHDPPAVVHRLHPAAAFRRRQGRHRPGAGRQGAAADGTGTSP